MSRPADGLRNMSYKISAQDRERIVKAMIAGDASGVLQRHYGVSRYTIWYHMHKAGYTCIRFRGSTTGVWAHASLVVLLLVLTGCVKAPQPRAEIPPPVGTNTYLVYDGKQLIWRELVGGPSGAIDTKAHPGEIELIPTSTAKYLRSPVSYAQSPAPGQLVVYGPEGATEQAIEASALTIPLVAIENGVLIPAATQPGRMIFGWAGDTYVGPGGKAFAAFGSMGFGGSANRAFVMPSAGTFKSLYVTTRGVQHASGALKITLAMGGEPIGTETAPPLTITIPAGSPAGIFEAGRDVKVKERDLVQIMLENAATANSAYLNAITAVFEF